MNDYALQMFGLRAKLAMAQEYLVDGTFNGARYYGVCRKHLRQHIPGVDIAGVRTLRQEGLLPDFFFADALELLAQQQYCQQYVSTVLHARGRRLVKLQVLVVSVDLSQLPNKFIFLCSQ